MAISSVKLGLLHLHRNQTLMFSLESLAIHKFRGLRDVELRDFGRFNVLVGLNNSGKTSVLEAIATYARPLRPSEWIDVVRRRDNSNSRAVLLEGLRWIFPQQDERSDKGMFFAGETKISGNGSIPIREVVAQFIELEGIFDDNEGDQCRSEDGILDIGGVRRGARLNLKASIEGSQTKLFGGMLRREESFQIDMWEGGRGPIAQNAAGFSLNVATITPFSHRIHNIDVEALSEADFADTKQTVVDLLQIFDPDIEDLDILKRPRSEPVIYVRHRRLGKTPLSTFGDGMRRALTMGANLAMVKGGILLVDEIESAIHSAALESTFRWLQEACHNLDVQLFTTTHSLEAVDALIAAGAAPEDLVVYRLDRRDSNTEVKRFSHDMLRVLREELGQEIRS
jgi:hypothetical protein